METRNENAVTAAQIANLVRNRKTLKVLGRVEGPVKISKMCADANNAKVIDAIKAAGWAPFHYDRAVDGIAEPWRTHVLWHEGCRKIAAKLHEWFDDVKPSNKIPPMLSACGALVLVSWLPQFKLGVASKNDETISKEKRQQVDEEHLAAASAMVQNLLLILTAHQMGTYWSSGGQFRTPTMFEKLGIGKDESLLAAVFVEYPDTDSRPVQRVGGKQRENRSRDFRWLREVNLEGRS